MDESKPREKQSNRKKRSRFLSFGKIVLLFILLLAIILPFTPARRVLGKIKRGIIEIIEARRPPETPLERPEPEVVIKEVIKEVLVKPDLPERFVSYKSIDTAELWNGFEVKSEFNVASGETATRERKKDDSFTIEMKVNVRVPKPNTTLEELASLNADLPKVLPALPAMVENGKVSGFYHHLYKVKTERMQTRLTRINKLLTKHNFFDCETILELTHPETRKKVLLIQGEMDVVSDGSDGDRMPEYDEYIATSSYYQPFTSYGWRKRSKQPNPLLARWNEKLAKAKAARNPSKKAIADLKLEIDDLKARSYLIARADPFVVIPGSLLGQTKKNAHAPAIGDYAVVIYKDKVYPAIVGDTGPSFQMGEASLRMAKQLNDKATPNNRPVSDLKVTYLVFPKTGEKPFGPPDLPRWRTRCQELLDGIGGLGEGVVLHEWEDYFKKEEPPAEGGETGAQEDAGL